MVEKILGVIDNTKGGFSTFTLVFTTERMIVALAESFLKSFKIGAAHVKPGPFGRAVGVDAGAGNAPEQAGRAKRAYAKEQAEKVESMDPDAILELDKKNFSGQYESVQSVEMRKGGFWSSTTITISTVDGKRYTYNILSSDLSQGISPEAFEGYSSIVKSAIGEKLSIK